MNPILRSLTVLAVTAGALVFAGCAVEAQGDDQADAEDTAEEALSATAPGFSGSWIDGVSTGSGAFFADLSLGDDHHYTGNVSDPAIRCVRAPCVLHESGTWNAYKSGTGFKVRLTNSAGARHIYAAALSGANLALTRAGATNTLTKKAAVCKMMCAQGKHCDTSSGTAQCVPNVTCAVVRCTASTHCDDTSGMAQCVPNVAVCNLMCIQGKHCDTSTGVARCIP